MKYIITLLIIICTLSYGAAQQTPGASQTQRIAIVGATAHIGDGTVLANSVIGFTNGKIDYVGTDKNKAAAYDLQVEATGKHVYPGFIATNSPLGLVEINAVRASVDSDELGDFLPHVRSLVAYDAESKTVESMRPNGVLMAQVVPQGGIISGSSSVMQLDAWNWEDAVLRADDGIHLNWPRPFTRGRWWLGESPDLKPNKNYPTTVKKIEAFFTQAKAYINDPQPKHLPYHAMKGVFEGTQQVFLHAQSAKQIKEGVRLLKQLGVVKVVVVGGHQAAAVVDFLKEHKIPVVISQPHRLPQSDDEDPKYTFKLARILLDNGITTSIDVSGRLQDIRNLPFYAGSFAAYGVPKEKAVQMLTHDAAAILGLEDQLGTLSEGKDATLFISQGDALDMRTNILELAFIQGRQISLDTHHTKLWKRYSNKYGVK